MVVTRDIYSIPTAVYASFSDTSFITGDSPVEHDVRAVLGRNGVTGFIDNYGSGALTYAISDDSNTSFGTEIFLPAGAMDSLHGYSIDTIRITWVADTSYAIRIR